ncbi:MAG: type II secretion system F family protein [Candidatus Woesearchaeota archaeon]
MKEESNKKISYIYPKETREHILAILSYNNIKKPYKAMLLILLISIVIGIALSLIIVYFSYGYKEIKLAIGFIILPIIIQVIIYTLFNLKAEKRGREIEELLPDALHLISQSLRAGSPTHQALTTACKSEFKSLNQEFLRVSSEVTLGEKLEDALEAMTKRVKSAKLKYVVDLMIFAIKSGGKLSDLLENTATDLRDQSLIDLKIKAETSKYKIMLMMALVGIVPFLFALVATIIKMFSNFSFGADMGTASSSIGPMLMIPKSVPITSEYFFKYSIAAIIIQMIFGSLIIGSISENKASRGLKYVPGMVIASLIIYMLLRLGIGSIVGGLF